MPKTKRDPTDLVTPDGYRLRMIYNDWYLRFERGGEIINHVGPFTHAEALIEAAKLTITDHDRGT